MANMTRLDILCEALQDNIGTPEFKEHLKNFTDLAKRMEELVLELLEEVADTEDKLDKLVHTCDVNLETVFMEYEK